MKKITLVVMILIIAMFSTMVFAVGFSDLSKEHWAYEPIIEMANKGILNGYPDGSFLPDKSITRAEFAKIIVLAMELGEKNANISFQDVPESHWAYSYVQTASKYLSAYRNNENVLMYMPDENAVREDVAVAIVVASGLENAEYNLNTLNRFSDKDQISESFRKYVAIAVENDLMHGHADGTFEPKGYLTRAQVSQLISNAEELKEKIILNETDIELFSDVKFDYETLQMDLGVNWDKYYFCTSPRADVADYQKGIEQRTVYIPAQRYLSYKKTTVNDERVKRTTYDYTQYPIVNEFTVILKEDMTKSKTIQYKAPFSYKTSLKDTENGTQFVIMASGANPIVKTSAVWMNHEGSYEITGSVLMIDVPFEGQDRAQITIEDEYGNYFSFSVPVETKVEEIEEENIFDDVRFDQKTLEMDLGENWDKYYFCIYHGNGKYGTLYIPGQRYLSYLKTNTDNVETGRTAYDFDQYSDYNEFAVVLKNDSSRFKSIRYATPFSIETEERETRDGNKVVDIYAKGANTIKKISTKWAECIETTMQVGDMLTIDVPFEGQDKLTITVEDVYGNRYDFYRTITTTSNDGELFEDVRFVTETLEIDLGENWRQYYFCSLNEYGNFGTIYTPAQRYLSYLKSSTEKIPNGRTSYDYGLGVDFNDFVVMLKDDSQKYGILTYPTPFNIDIDQRETRNGFKVDICVNGANEIQKISTKWENNEETNMQIGDMLTVDVPFEGKDTLIIMVEDIYGNKYSVKRTITTPSDDEELFADVRFDEETLQIDLGANWDKYYFCSAPRKSVAEYEAGLKNHTVYKPAQRYLSYAAPDNNILTGRTTYDYDFVSMMTPFTVILKEDMTKTKTIVFMTPFKVTIDPADKNDSSKKTIVVTGPNQISKLSTRWDDNQRVTTVYSNSINIVLTDDLIHEIEITAEDTYGNRMVMTRKVKR